MKQTIPGLVSVILVNFRGADDTLEAVRGLKQLNWPEGLLEIIVVENGSGDDSLQKFATLSTDVTVIESAQNLGFTGGCNLGVAKARGEFVAFLNNDARPHPDWIKHGIATFDAGKDIGAVASKVLDWDGERVDFVDAAVTWYGMGYKPHAGEIDRNRWDDEKDVLFGTGAAMFVRASVFRELEGFDDDFFMFYDDVDLGWRLNLLGYRFRYQPRSLVFHKHHASMEKFGSFREEYLLERNALFTIYKNLDDASLAQALPAALLLAVRRSVARGQLDSTALDLRTPGNDAESAMAVPKSTVAGIFAVDQFVEMLPKLSRSRERIQRTRKRSDRELKALMGNLDEPAFPLDYYLAGYSKIAESLGILTIPERRRIVIVTGDPVGEKMAGPAIRAWNIAKLLSKEHDVRLISTNRAVSLDDSFDVLTVPQHEPRAMAPHEEWADVIIVQGHALQYFPSLEGTAKVLVVDIYDPLHLEQLEQGRSLTLTRWNDQISHSAETLNHQMLLGDFFLAASERQRHFWLGQLAALGRVNAFTYSRDTQLDSLIAIAPFGIPAEEPVKSSPAIRGVVPGIGEDDKIVIWGGGIYDWFDPDTLIRAIGTISETHPDIRLLFMGVKHPNPDVPEMVAVSRARLLATELGLINKHVFFNEAWVPYDERQNYLLEADLGVSTHFNHVETTFSFRTRILDYLWAGLPIVSTEGDSFGDLVTKEDLGAAVPERDETALVEAISSLLYDSSLRAAARANVSRVREEFRWEKAMAPLLAFCRDPAKAADREMAVTVPSNRESLATRIAGRRSSNYTGLRRDLDRALYYLRNGGPSAVIERLRARRERLKGAK